MWTALHPWTWMFLENKIKQNNNNTLRKTKNKSHTAELFFSRDKRHATEGKQVAAGKHPKTHRGFWLPSWEPGPDTLCLNTALLWISKPERMVEDRSLLPPLPPCRTQSPAGSHWAVWCSVGRKGGSRPLQDKNLNWFWSLGMEISNYIYLKMKTEAHWDIPVCPTRLSDARCPLT